MYFSAPFGFLHMIGMLSFLVGFLFLVRLAFTTLTHAQMKTWGIGLVIGGILLCIISMGTLESGVHRMQGPGMMMKSNTMMKGATMMHDMMDEKDDMESMSMHGMMVELEGKTGDAFDKAFLETMIVHHEGAIDMANQAKTSAGHAEIKALADAIITAQQEEIDMMKNWQTTWGYEN